MSALWIIAIVVLAVGGVVLAVVLRHAIEALRDLRAELRRLGDLGPALTRAAQLEVDPPTEEEMDRR